MDETTLPVAAATDDTRPRSTRKITYVSRDGVKVSPYMLGDDAPYHWLLRHQGQSTHWALTHEGYRIETLDLAPRDPQHNPGGSPRGAFTHDHGSLVGESRDERNLVRANCGACVLAGYRDRDDDESPTDAPNYAGWARLYVETRRPVPEKWLTGFERDLNEDSPYGQQLRLDVVTYGVVIAAPSV